MTIGDYIRQLQAVNAEALAVEAMDANEDAITSYTIDSWRAGTNPDGEYLFKASWAGSEVSDSYRRQWGISINYTYSYRTINISGDTRRNLQVRGGRIFSTTDYWANILRSFGAVEMSPVSFARVPTSIPAKRLTATSFFKMLRARLAHQ